MPQFCAACTHRLKTRENTREISAGVFCVCLCVFYWRYFVYVFWLLVQGDAWRSHHSTCLLCSERSSALDQNGRGLWKPRPSSPKSWTRFWCDRVESIIGSCRQLRVTLCAVGMCAGRPLSTLLLERKLLYLWLLFSSSIAFVVIVVTNSLERGRFPLERNGSPLFAIICFSKEGSIHPLSARFCLL